jgi:hypothetical protein
MHRHLAKAIVVLLGCASAAGAVPPYSLLQTCQYGIKEPTMKVRRLGTPIGDEKMRFGGILPARDTDVVDPAASGLWLFLISSDPATLVDVTAPAGAGWRAHRGGTRWRYRASVGSNDGILRASVKEVAANPAWGLHERAYAVRVTLAPGAFASQSDLDTHYVTLGISTDEATSVCRSHLLYPPVIYVQPDSEPWETPSFWARCRMSPGGTRLSCRPPDPAGPCGVGDPEDLMLCDALGAAAAQEAHRTETGSYFQGECHDLPGFQGSPDVACTSNSNGTRASVHTTHPQMPMSVGCIWDSESEPTPVCY